MTLDSTELSNRLRNRYGIKWTKFDHGVIPMWIADMDFGASSAVQEAMRNAIGGFGLGYARQSLHDEVLESLSARYRRLFSTAIDPARSVLSTDVVQAIYIAIATLTEVSDKIIVQSPIYPPFIGAIGDLKREVVFNQLRETPDGFEFDMDHLEALCSDPGTPMMLLCNPHNPTGRVMTEAELDQVASIAARHNVIVVVDEIHAEIAYEPYTHVPFARAGALHGTENLLLTSASKAFNLAGLRCAVANFSSSELLERYNSVPFHMRGAVSNLGMVGTIAAWTDSDDWLDKVMSRLKANRHIISEFIAQNAPSLSYCEPQGTYLAWLDFRSVSTAEDPAEIIQRLGGVALSPGVNFGPGGQGHARLNFATSEANLNAGLERICATIPKFEQ